MNRQIKTYEELVQEEQRLQAQLESYKTVIAADISAVKDGINPVKRIKAMGRRVFTRGDNGPVLNFGLNFGIDLLIRRMLLARAGWVYRFLVPFVVKNYASHIVSEEDREKITKSVKRWVRKLKQKLQKSEPAHETTVS